jgi:uncharacterized damage-inducible protein DinB
MPTKDAWIAELKHELDLTRRILERVPMDKKDWKPHDKSMTIGRLATHVAETPLWVQRIQEAPEFDFFTANFKGHTAADQAELMDIFTKDSETAIASLANMEDEDFGKPWIVRRGEQVMFNTPTKVAIRSWAISHLIHHRGQLSVYLRLLDVPVPGMYGPSADERM